MTIIRLALLIFLHLLYHIQQCSSSYGQVCLGLCHCIRDTVDCSSLDLAEIPTTIPNNTRILILSDNEIEDVDGVRLERFGFLHTLDLSNNLIRSIPAEFFSNAPPSLRVINLRKNRLSRIPTGFLANVDRLDLRSNLINNISPDEFSQLANIRHVDLSRNLISNLPKVPVTGNVTKIERLDLASNAILDIFSDTFLSFQSLVSLKLSRNRISSLSQYAFSRLLHLETIDLTRNLIREVKYFAFNQLPALKNVTISKNDIYRLDDGIFYACENVQRLNLANNRIQSVTIGWLFGLTNLQHLDLSFNQIQSFDINSWSHTPNLKWLNLHSNRIQSLPSRSFRALRKLEELTLSANSINSLHKFALVGMDNLHRLDLSSNTLAVCVEDGAVLYNTSMPFLRSLRFTNNQLRVIPSRAFERFPALEELDITGNPIATIHPDAFEPLDLKRLFMNSSSILCDCQISWLAPWIVKLKLDRSKIIAKCSYPSVMQNLDVMAIDRSNLTCLDDSPRPKIVAQPESQNSIVSQRSRFTCNAYGEGPLEIEWRVVENGQARVLDQDSVTFMTVNTTAIINGTMDFRELAAAELILENVTLSDSLEYQCVARNRFGTDFSKHVELHVHEPPVFTSIPSDMILLTGQSAKFECAAIGTPSPTLKWAFDRGLFPAAESRRLYVIPNDDHIYIMNVTMADEGVYSCHAMNPAGSIQSSARLTVFQNEFRTIVDPKIVVIRGESLEIDCFSNLINETQKMIWKKNEQIIAWMKNDEQMLLVENAQFSDSGEYKCELWAKEATTLLAVQVTNVTVVLESEISKADTIRQKAAKLKTFAVKFAKNPENQSLIYTIAIICLLVSLGFCTSLSICSYTFWKQKQLQKIAEEVFV